MDGKLILVGTPIGNLSDISERAIEALRNADFIAAEDTRVTLKLLNHFGIKNNMISYYEHNKKEKGNVILNRIVNGETCVLVSDAGMPAISDPGEDLVRKCIDSGIQVSVIPGPCAAISALAMSGLGTGRFTFEGFLSMNRKNRSQHLQSLERETRTMIFYEAPHKFKHTLMDMFDVFGDRKISIVREITKIHEEVIHTSFKSAIERFNEENIRGEIVLIVEGYTCNESEDIKNYSISDAIKFVKKFQSEGLKYTDAVKKTAKLTGLNRSLIYKNALYVGEQYEK